MTIYPKLPLVDPSHEKGQCSLALCSSMKNGLVKNGIPMLDYDNSISIYIYIYYIIYIIYIYNIYIYYK